MTDPTTPPPAQPTPDPTGEPPPDRTGGPPRDETVAAEAAAVPAAEAAAIPAAGAATPPIDGATAPADGESTPPAEAPADATAVAAAAVATTPEATAQPAASSTAAATSRRATALRALRTFGVFVVTIALFVGGLALGTYAFQNSRAAPVGGANPAVDLSTAGPPPVAQEFIAALANNDADALRSSLDQEPHLDLTREMTKFGIQRVDNVQTLGTHVDGARSATEILMQYESTDGTPFAINLVILVDGGKIEGFR